MFWGTGVWVQRQQRLQMLVRRRRHELRPLALRDADSALHFQAYCLFSDANTIARSVEASRLYSVLA